MKNIFLETERVIAFREAISVVTDTKKGQPGLMVVWGKPGRGKTECAKNYAVRTDAQGRLVPMDMVKEIDKIRDSLVVDLVAKAKTLQEDMIHFKETSMGEINSFVDLSAMEWDVKIGGKKGNISLLSFNGKFKAQVHIKDYLIFDEQLQIAKKLIDERLNRWTKGSRSEIRALINDAFQVDKEGRINTKRILSLRRLDIQDPQWVKAMDLITASLQVMKRPAVIMNRKCYKLKQDVILLAISLLCEHWPITWDFSIQT